MVDKLQHNQRTWEMNRNRIKSKTKPYKQHLSKSEDSPISACMSLSLEPDPYEVSL